MTLLQRHGSRLIRFGLVGASGVLVNSAILFLLVEMGHTNKIAAAAVATEAAILSNFSLNDVWTFRDARADRSWFQRALRYNIVALGGFVISLVVLAALTYVFHMHYMVANLFAIAAALLWNYVVNAMVTWSAPARADLAA